MTEPGDLTASQVNCLRSAELIVKHYAEEIQTEMRDQGNKGHLWQNGRCKAWPDYERAVANQQMLRAKYGV